MRTVFLIDRFNLYHALDGEPSYHQFKWVSFSRLVRAYLDPGDTVEGIYYFTALATWNPAKVVRHRLFIKAQENEGVRVVYGEFKKRDKFCSRCHRSFITHEEKRTDVNIALHLLGLAVTNGYDKAVLISGDTDLAPAIEVVRQVYPSKLIGAVIPIGRRSDRLKTVVNFHRKMKLVHLQKSRLDDQITLPDGTVLTCPPTWK